jgi:hypothetical protein
MKTKNTESSTQHQTTHASHAHPSGDHPAGTHATHPTTETIEIAPALSTPPATAQAATPPATASPVAEAAAVSATSLSPPPATANIPPVPSNFVAPTGPVYRGVSPKKAELTVLSQAVEDLKKFVNFTAILGGTVPPYADVLALFIAVNAWSSMRTASTNWDAFCRVQEGIGWTLMRTMMARLLPAFDLAATGNSSLPVMYPSLATLLGAKKSIAQKAVSTKRLNTKAVSEGKPPVHGGVGKKLQKKAAKAALAAQSANVGAGSPVGAPAAQAAATQAPATVTATPVVATAPVAQATQAPAPQGAASGSNAATAAPVVTGTGGATPVVNGAR